MTDVSLEVSGLAFAYPDGHQALFGVVPGPQAVVRLGELLVAGGEDIGTYAIPAPMTDGIRLMVVGGVVLIGLAMGGVLGVGTLVYAFAIGPIAQALMPYFLVDLRPADEPRSGRLVSPHEQSGASCR